MKRKKHLNNEYIDYNLLMSNITSQWSTTMGENVNVAILDTGIDYTHQNLKNSIKGGINFTSSNKLDFIDRNGHGTFVAGIIAGEKNENGIGGIAPKCNLYSVKILSDNCKGSIDNLSKGIDWCIENNINIISMSLSYPIYNKQVHEIIKKAYDNNIILIAAAGNNKKTKIDFPARHDEVIGVTSINKNKKLSKFSNTGNNINFCAPGDNIISTYLNNSYTVMSGTSMSVPHMTGIIALIQSKSLKANGKLLNFKELMEVLLKNSIDLGDSGYDKKYGYGLFKF